MCGSGSDEVAGKLSNGPGLTVAVGSVSKLTHDFCQKPHFFAGHWQDISVSHHVDLSVRLLESPSWHGIFHQGK